MMECVLEVLQREKEESQLEMHMRELLVHPCEIQVQIDRFADTATQPETYE
jgi:hypothetical protein